MTLSNLFQLRTLLVRLSEELLPLSVSFQIARFLKETDASYSLFTTRYSKIVETYGARDADGNLIYNETGLQLIPETMEKANQELQELNDFEVETPPLSLNYEDLANLQITPKDLYILMPYLKTNEKEETN